MTMTYESTKCIESTVSPGVRFTIARMTFGRRIDLMRRVRQLSGLMEFSRAGVQIDDRIQAGLAGAEIDELYLRWGLVSIEGLQLDGLPADLESLISSGPEPLCREIIAAVKRECTLTDEERKN
jgi:hypothetical protein